MLRLPSNSSLKIPGSLPLHLYQGNHSFLQAFWAHRLFHRITRQPKMQAVCVHLNQLVITPVYKLVQTIFKRTARPEVLPSDTRRSPYEKACRSPLCTFWALFRVRRYLLHILDPHQPKIFHKNPLVLGVIHRRLPLHRFDHLSVRIVLTKSLNTLASKSPGLDFDLLCTYSL